MDADRAALGRGAAGGVRRASPARAALLPLLLYALPLGFLALFFFFPLGAILRLSAGVRTAVDADDLAYFVRVIGFSAWLGALSAALTLLVALPGAYMFARFRFPGAVALRALATVPFVLPTVVVAAAFGELLGPRGLLPAGLARLLGAGAPPLALERSIWLVLLAHIFFNYSIVLRIVGGFWAGIDVRLEQAAAVLGASRWRAFRHVTLPLLLPAIGAAALLVFIYCFASFGIVLILGGAQMATVEVEIYRQTAQMLRLDVASALALVQIAVTLLATMAYTRLQERTSLALAARGHGANARPPRTMGERLLIGANALLILLLIGAPLAALAARSLTSADGTPTLAFYRALGENTSRSLFFVPPLVAVRNSLLFAAATVALSLAVGVPAAYLLAWGRRGGWLVRVLDPLFTLPLGTSAVTLGLGYIVAFGAWGWQRSPLMVPVAHSLLAFPLVVRSLLPALRAIDQRLREAARTLGASPAQVLRQIDLPLLAPAVLVGAVYAFTISLGDFGAVLLIGQNEYPTIPLVIYRFLGRPGGLNYGQAMALCTILMLVSLACFALLERARPPQAEL